VSRGARHDGRARFCAQGRAGRVARLAAGAACAPPRRGHARWALPPPYEVRGPRVREERASVSGGSLLRRRRLRSPWREETRVALFGSNGRHKTSPVASPSGPAAHCAPVRAPLLVTTRGRSGNIPSAPAVSTSCGPAVIRRRRGSQSAAAGKFSDVRGVLGWYSAPLATRTALSGSNGRHKTSPVASPQQGWRHIVLPS